MASTTLHEIGLGTLEERRIQAPYEEFWRETYPTAINQHVQLSPEVVARIGRAADFVSEVTDKVVRGREIDSLGDFPEFLTDPKYLPGGKRRYSSVIGTWADSLGSLCAMAGGQGDLLRAAGTTLEQNVKPEKVEGFTPVSEEDPRNTYKAFTSLWSNNDVADQRPGPALMQAAELVHRAAWIDEDPQRQERLLGVAKQMYERVYGADEIKPKRRRLIENFMGDINFHALSAQARKAKARGNTTQQSEALEQMDQQVHRDARRLHERYSEVDRTIDAGRGPGGELFEDFVTLALRKSIVAGDTPEFEVRHAFGHEDNSLPGVLPKAAFDIVVQRYQDKGITTTPVQLKLRMTNRHEDKDKADYLPGILLMSVSGLPLRTLSRATHALAEGAEVAQTKNRRMNERLAPFKRLEKEVLPLLLEAS